MQKPTAAKGWCHTRLNSVCVRVTDATSQLICVRIYCSVRRMHVTHEHTHSCICWLQSVCGATQTIRLFKQRDLQIEGRFLFLKHTHTFSEWGVWRRGRGRYRDQKGSAAVGLRESWQGHTLSLSLLFPLSLSPPSLTPGISSFILPIIFSVSLLIQCHSPPTKTPMRPWQWEMFHFKRDIRDVWNGNEKHGNQFPSACADVPAKSTLGPKITRPIW